MHSATSYNTADFSMIRLRKITNVGFRHVFLVYFYHRLMMGSMLPTWFLSMWISNTAAVAMMLPILEAIMEQLDPDIINQKGNRDKVSTPLVILCQMLPLIYLLMLSIYSYSLSI